MTPNLINNEEDNLSFIVRNTKLTIEELHIRSIEMMEGFGQKFNSLIDQYGENYSLSYVLSVEGLLPLHGMALRNSRFLQHDISVR